MRAEAGGGGGVFVIWNVGLYVELRDTSGDGVLCLERSLGGDGVLMIDGWVSGTEGVTGVECSFFKTMFPTPFAFFIDNTNFGFAGASD